MIIFSLLPFFPSFLPSFPNNTDTVMYGKNRQHNGVIIIFISLFNFSVDYYCR